MCYQIIPTPKFQEDVKFYERKRKYYHIDDDVESIVEELEKGNLIGTPIDDINLPDGEDSYKVRAINTDTKEGKSNGYRIIYYVIKNDKVVYLLTIYSKKDDGRIVDKTDIRKLIEKYC